MGWVGTCRAWGEGGGELLRQRAGGRGLSQAAASCSACGERREKEGGGKKEKEGKWKKEKEKEKERNRERKREREKRERERKSERFVAATAAGRARAPVGRDARDKGEQGDGTAMDSDVGIGFFGRSGDRAEKKMI